MAKKINTDPNLLRVLYVENEETGENEVILTGTLKECMAHTEFNGHNICAKVANDQVYHYTYR